MKEFLYPSKLSLVLYFLFFLSAAHFSIGLVISRNCGDPLGFCAPAPGANAYVLAALAVWPISLIDFPVSMPLHAVINRFDRPYAGCELNQGIGGANCYIAAATAFFVQAVVLYFYANLLVYAYRRDRKRTIIVWLALVALLFFYTFVVSVIL